MSCIESYSWAVNCLLLFPVSTNYWSCNSIVGDPRKSCVQKAKPNISLSLNMFLHKRVLDIYLGLRLLSHINLNRYCMICSNSVPFDIKKTKNSTWFQTVCNATVRIWRTDIKPLKQTGRCKTFLVAPILRAAVAFASGYLCNFLVHFVIL